MSLPILVAIAVYFIVALLCLSAALAGALSRRPVRQPRRWLACAAFFGLLAFVRLLDVENRTRETLRAISRGMGEYEDRGTVQVPLVGVTLILALALAILAGRSWMRRRSSRSDRLLLLGQMAVLGFLPLYALRIISLHQVDRILYGGSLRLNWTLDLGLAALAAGSAMLYVQHCRRFPRRR